MDTNLKIQPTAVPVSDAEQARKPDWHAPVITRIDIKWTMDSMAPYISGDYTATR